MIRILLAALVVTGCHRGAREASLLVESTLESGGRTRTYLSYTPPNPAGRPLVIALHGRGGDGRKQEKLSGFTAIAARERLFYVAPDGIDESWADARAATPASKQGVDDVAFVSDLIHHFVGRGADQHSVHVLGMSNGAMMSLTLACRLAGRLSTVVAVTGLVPKTLENSCDPARAVTVAFVLGEDDPMVPFDGGTIGRDRGEVLSADASVALWRRLDGCSDVSKTTELPNLADDGTTTTSTHWSACRGGAQVVRFVVRGGGHTWPGGYGYLPELVIGRTSRDWSASEAAWALFAPQKPE